MVSFLSRCDQWHFYMNTRIIEFLILDQILLGKLINESFQLADLRLHTLQFWIFSNVILLVEQGNVYLIKIWRHWFLLLHPPWSSVPWIQISNDNPKTLLNIHKMIPTLYWQQLHFVHFDVDCRKLVLMKPFLVDFFLTLEKFWCYTKPKQLSVWQRLKWGWTKLCSNACNLSL